MKKLFVLVIVLFPILAFAQVATIVKDLGTMANSVDETGYIDLPDGVRVDSISVNFVGIGELDVDSVTLYKANKVGGMYISDVTVLGNFTVTLNLAAAGEDLEQLYSSNATLLSAANIRGCNAIKYLTRGAASGNDATDPNHGWIVFRIWGVKL